MVTDIPEIVRVPVNGCDDVFFMREDFYDDTAWLRFLLNEEMKWWDFKTKNKWIQYFILSMGLTEGIVLVGGKLRSGKSLWMHWIAMQLRDLFGKRVTCDVRPAKGFGEYSFTNADIFVNEWSNLSKTINDSGEDNIDRIELDKHSTLCNRVYFLDEAHKSMPKRGLTKYGMMLGDANIVTYHFHNLMVYATGQVKLLDNQHLVELATHRVLCGWGLFSKGKCGYIIQRVNPQISKQMELDPSEWSHIWNTHSLITMRENVDKKLLRQKEREIKEARNVN